METVLWRGTIIVLLCKCAEFFYSIPLTLMERQITENIL